MKQLIIFLTVIILASCKGGENKADQSGDELAPAPRTDTLTDTPAPKQPEQPNTSSGQSRGVELTKPADILASIDKHLVSAVQFKPAAGGGFTDCIVTVTNTLPDVTFQKALVELTVKKDDTIIVKKDYYTVVNIEPGVSKIIKVPNFNLGNGVSATVVKVKSMELTNGEFVMAGTPR